MELPTVFIPKIVNKFHFNYVFSVDGQDYNDFNVDTKNVTNGTAKSIYTKNSQ